MWYLVFKAGLSGAIIMLVSEIARRSPSFGALVASLPLISLMGIMWLWRDTGDRERIAQHAYYTFWYVLPSLPLFLALPMLLRHGMNFWAALAFCCALTVALYFSTAWILARFGVRL